MIQKYNQYIKESLLSNLKGPTEEEIKSKLKRQYDNGEINISKYYNKSNELGIEGPSEEEIWNNFKDLKPHQILINSLNMKYLKGIKYALKYDVDMKIYGLETLKTLLKFLYENNENELIFKCIEDYFKLKKIEVYYYLLSCMYGYLKGVQNVISEIKKYSFTKHNNYAGLELAIKNNQLDIVIYLIEQFESTDQAYEWESRAKEYADEYNNRDVKDFFLKFYNHYDD